MDPVRTAMILAAGEGRRLRPLTREVPKPLIEVGGRPLLDWLLRWLAGQGMAEVVLNVHHLADQVTAFVEAARPRFDLALRISREAELLGTGGGIRKAADGWSDPHAWIVNGDVVTDLDLARVTAAAPDDADGVLILRSDPRAVEAGPIWVRPAEAPGIHRVTGMLDRGESTGEPLLFTGIHLLRRERARSLPEAGCVVRDGYLEWLGAGRLYAWIHDGYWDEIGTPERLERVRSDALAGRIAWMAGAPKARRRVDLSGRPVASRARPR